MSHLALFLLGPPCIERDGDPIKINRRKAIALIAYLAVTGESHARGTLATLFWPESNQAQARAALRKALSVLKKAIGEEWLEIERENLALKRSADFWLDVDRFRGRLAECQTHGHATDEVCPACLASLSEAVALYRDDFLAGFTLRNSPGFDDWQFFQSEGLRRELSNALEKLVRGHSLQEEFEPAITHARRWLALDPLCEPVHRLTMQLYARAGQHTAALRQYQECVQILEQELGVPPQEETTCLYQTIQGNRGRQPIAPITHPLFFTRTHNLPLQPTPFVGREDELVKMDRLLKNTACRLLTLVGPGGIGKTRLALQFAGERAEAFYHGVYFAPLAPLNSAHLLVPTIADALKFSFHGRADPKTQLLDYLREKEMLLLLDNFEHLLNGVGLLAEILSSAPGVELLVTSRERLNLRWEWPLEIKGLEFPQDGQTVALEEYSAVQLFLHTATRSHPGFSLSEEEKLPVIRICQILEGVPLGIELAAAWVEAFSCHTDFPYKGSGGSQLASILCPMTWGTAASPWGLVAISICRISPASQGIGKRRSFSCWINGCRAISPRKRSS